MVQLPWSDFKRIRIYKVFGPLIRCKLNVNQKEWPGTKKWMCWFLFFFQYMTLMVVTLVFHNTPIKPKARVDVNKWSVEGDQSGVEIILTSCTPLMFEIGFYFRSLTTIKPIIKEAPIYLGHRCPIVKFISLCPKMAVLKKVKFDHSFCLLFFSSSLPPRKFSWKNYYRNILCQGSLPFSIIAPPLPLPPQNPLDHANG